MPIADVLRRGLKYLAGALFALYVAAPVYAFTPAQVPLLSSSAVPPNLMLMVDNSGSMSHMIRASGFNPSTNYGSIAVAFNNYQIQYFSGENFTLSQFNQGRCNAGFYFFYWGLSYYCLGLPNPAGSSTLYSSNYLAYLARQAGLATTRDYRDRSANPVIPQVTRMSVAIDVSKNIVTSNPGIRMGLSTLNVGTGSHILQEVGDISNSTAASRLINGIDSLQANGGTALAETYYEITRYFRGLSSFSPGGLSYRSPIQYRCQKNYGVVITDGLPSNDRTFPGRGGDPDDPNGRLPNWDGSATGTDGPNTGSNADGDTLYLDDIAKFAYDIDMRKATGTSNVDGANKSWDSPGFVQQNMSTYTVGFTVANQMLQDAAAYGQGTYYTADDFEGLTTALNAALSEISSKAGSGGGGSANSTTLTAGTRFYQTLYDPTDWHGTIRAYDLDSTTGALNTSNLAWNTDNTIGASGAAATSYYSWNTDGQGSAIRLEYANFSPGQRTAIDRSIPSDMVGVTGTSLISWAKGSAVNGLRTRTRYLGDIVNSPLVPALPNDKTATDLVGDVTYTAYLSLKANTMPSRLLVNANDGFLHVISAQRGVQEFAYMPSTAVTSISTLADTDYGINRHIFTADGPVSVFDTQATATSAWRTVAYGGTGAGGKAFYAVKLFDATGSTITPLWEVKAPDATNVSNNFNDLGYAYAKPDVARMNDTARTGIVVLGNGYGSNTGVAALYVLNANTGAFIRKIVIPPQAGETDNGLSSVKLQVNSQNVVEAAYAGDLKGRLWKFDLSSSSPGSWGIAYGGNPLFTTPRGDQASSTVQPITVQPILMDHPTNSGKMVYFGTGKFNEAADKQSTAQQTFYAVWDNGIGNLTLTNLQAQAINPGTVSGNGNTYYTTTRNDVDWAVKKGWYLPLGSANPYLGERIIYPAQTSRGRIIFTTAAVNSTDPCESTGTGRLFELDAAKGGMLNYSVLDTNGDNDVTDTDTLVSGIAVNTGIPNLASIVAGLSGANDNKYLLDSSGGTPVKIIEKGGSANVYQRIMWRQIQ